MDTSERARATEAIRASEAKFSKIFSAAPALITLSDPADGVYHEVNERFVHVSGFSREEAIGRTPVELGWVTAEDRARLVRELETNGRVSEMELELHAKDHRIVHCLYDGELLIIDHRPLLLLIALDITEHKRMEAYAQEQRRRLIQSSKMATIGILAAGVAHEINNPNFLIMMNISLIKDAWEGILPILERYHQENGDFRVIGRPYPVMKEEMTALFSDMLEATGRIKHIVKELSDYSHNVPQGFTEQVDLNASVHSALTLLANAIKKSTERLSVACATDLPTIRGSASRLEQAILNLVHNACQALPDRSRGIFVSTYCDIADHSVVVEVRDEGVGLPPDILPHLTDPFFTTRRESGSKGLGLAVSEAIAQEHGGRLELTSTSGEGTTARLVIPIEAPAQ